MMTSVDRDLYESYGLYFNSFQVQKNNFYLFLGVGNILYLFPGAEITLHLRTPVSIFWYRTPVDTGTVTHFDYFYVINSCRECMCFDTTQENLIKKNSPMYGFSYYCVQSAIRESNLILALLVIVVIIQYIKMCFNTQTFLSLSLSHTQRLIPARDAQPKN